MTDNTTVWAQLVALAGSPVILHNVVDYLNQRAPTPTADEIADEIVKRSARAERRR